MLAEAEVTPPIEPVLPPRIPPWERGGDVTFRLDVGPLRVAATQEKKVRAVTQHLGSLHQCAVWLWTDTVGRSSLASASWLCRGHRQIHAQWVPSHCWITGNERADSVTKEAEELPQQDVPVDVRTIGRAVARTAREATIATSRPDGSSP